jgi:hypothetical protein
MRLRFPRRCIGNIKGKYHGAAARCFDLTFRSFETIDAARDETNFSAALSKLSSRSPAQTRRGSSDYNDFFLQIVTIPSDYSIN